MVDLTAVPQLVDTSEKTSNSATGPGTSNQLTSAQIGEIQRSGYKLLGETYRSSIDAQCIFLEHERTGATVALVQISDPHLRAELRFRTLPDDSSGALHKLEHGVISELARIPVADVYDEMSRSLLLTEVNAGTGQDYTTYYASGVDEYSVNLMAGVFTDSVLKGRPSRQTYLREHGHLRPDSKSPSGYRFGGVVYDEMLGYYDGASRWAHMAWRRGLFPGSPYSQDSAGEPSQMLDLTLERYQAAYDKNYGPSKAIYGLYGNTPLAEKLSLVNQLLEGYERGEPAAPYPAPVTFDSPQSVEARIPADLQSPVPPEQQYQLWLSWKFPRITDHQTSFEMGMLSNLLSAGEYSPFTHAYRNAGIKNVHLGSGMASAGMETVFSIYFGNSTREALPESQAATEEILSQLATTGFPRPAIDGMLSYVVQSEIKRNRSVSIGRNYVNAQRLETALEHAMRGEYRIDPLSMRDRAGLLREKLDAGEPVFERLLQSLILTNANRLNLTLSPDAKLVPEWLADMDRQTAELAAISDPQEIARTADEMRDRERQLEEGQQLDRAPKATLHERYRRTSAVPHSTLTHDGVTVTHFRQDLGDQATIELRFDISHIPVEELPLAKFLISTVTQLGSAGKGQGEFAIDMMTIGASVHGDISTNIPYDVDLRSPHAVQTSVIVDATIPAERIAAYLDLITAALDSPQLDNFAFLEQQARRYTTHYGRVLNDTQHLTGYLHSYLEAAMSPDGIADLYTRTPDKMLPSVADAGERLAADSPKFVDELRDLHERIFRRGNLSVTVIASDEQWAHFAGPILQAVDSLKGGKSELRAVQFLPSHDTVGLESDLNNNYVGMRAQLLGDDGAPLTTEPIGWVASSIIDRFLNSQVRKIGGAYGSQSVYDARTGQFSFVSWQDPEIARTIEVYRQSVEFLRGATQDLLDRAKVTSMKSFEAPRSPEDEAELSAAWRLRKLTVEEQNRRRSGIMDATLEDLHRFADLLKSALESESAIRVIGARAALEHAIDDGVPLEVRRRL